MTAQASSEVQWLTTAPNPASGPGMPFWSDYDQGQRGWRLHAIEASESETLDAIRFRRSACGLYARHGWNLDMFIDQRCVRCARALGLPETYPEQVRREQRAALRQHIRDEGAEL